MDENVAEVVAAPDFSAMRLYYKQLQIDYAVRAAEIESFLGFAESSEAIGTRLHKIEAFLGIKG